MKTEKVNRRDGVRAEDLYARLEADFVLPGISDDWFPRMADMEAHVCEQFKERSIGLLYDFADTVSRVYTAVFPSERVIGRIIADSAEDAMLFVHHPMMWDFSRVARGETNSGFYPIPEELTLRLKERSVSVYNLHHPLDNFGVHSTSKSLADALGIQILRPFFMSCGAMCGVIGRSDCGDITRLHSEFSALIGHEAKLYAYGGEEISGGLVAIVAGGGNTAAVARELCESGVNALVTGITRVTAHSAPVHEYERENGLNLLGGTHYSTEKFACMSMCGYFKALGLDAVFVGDGPCMEDL